MSQIATGLGSHSRSVPVPPFYDIPGVNEIKPDNKFVCTGSSVLKSPVDKKSCHFTEERNTTEIPNRRGSTNHVTFLRTYKVIYLGYAVLDRRYTLPMLPWVIAEIKRHGSQNREEIFIEVTEQSLKAVNCENNLLVFEHKLQTISKFAQSSHDSSCFTYMTREVLNGPCAYHVFQASDESTVLELFTTIREATKEISTQQTQAPTIINTPEGMSLNSVINNCQQYEVLYLGRIKVSGKRAPPTFIDDAVEKFRIYEAEKSRSFQNGLSNTRKRHGSGASVTSLPTIDSLVENVHGNGQNKPTISSEGNTCGLNSPDTKTLDIFNHISCDNYADPFVQSPLSPMCNSAHLHKFHLLDQSSAISTHDQFIAPSHTRKDGKSSNSQNSLMPPSSLITHTQSLDSPGCADIVRDLRQSDPSVMLRDRVRSCSGDIPRTKQTSLPTFRHRIGSGGATELVRPRAYTSPNPTSNHQQNRTMLFIIGRSEICLIGMDKKQMLLSKTFNDIAHCSQGVKHLDHFGFISRETTLTGGDCYAGYIFRCQTEKVVDEIMATLKQAFNQAHHCYQNFTVKNQQVPKIVVCDSCPMHWFHMLCSDIEGLSDEETHLSILQKLGTLADDDKIEIMVKLQNSDFIDVQEQNEVLMMLLREFCEQRQMKHSHVPNTCTNGKSESVFIKEKYSKLDTLRQKAKSLSSSLETFLKLSNRDDGKDSPCAVENNIVTISEDEQTCYKDLDTRSYREGSYTNDHSSDRLSPILTRPRSSTFSSPREKIPTNKKINQQDETPKKRPIINMFIKSGYRNKSPSPTFENSPKGSWRQAIFHRVQTPVQNNKHGVHNAKLEENGSSEDESKPQEKKSKEELRSLWRKAIIEQILLIRMEKENKKLQVNQDAASHKRMKLNYKEITPCLKTSAMKWEEILLNPDQHETNLDKSTLMIMVKSGVPRHKRGDIWQFLAEYNKNAWNSCGNSDIDLSTPYDDLLKQLTSHQHSILIDIGRTFPNHPFYSQSLGSGQLSLFNLLKAYSLLDNEVGYCQGLSFVAGILLLHMSEEQAFSLMKHLMFSLGLRRQYKTDMVAFQIQMYQLSRLIHDNYRDLYDHLEKFDIAPTLYAAPWFLTLFASQFPVGFVARLFDLIFLNGMEVVFKVSLMLLGNYKNDILYCDSFESIMDYLKTVLPSIDVLQMEIIFNQVFNLDISRQLHAYEVEYHVLLEEMIHSPSKNNAELENLQTANKNLKAQNMELMEQLQVAYSRIHNLEASETSLKSSVRLLEARVASLEDEKEALVHSFRIMKSRLERLEASRIEDIMPEIHLDHPPPFGVVYALAGSEREEDENFRQLMKKISFTKECELVESPGNKISENDTELDDASNPPDLAVLTE